MTDTAGSERDTMDVGQPEEAELADEELGRGKPAQADKELEPLEGGAETDADEEGAQAKAGDGATPV